MASWLQRPSGPPKQWVCSHCGKIFDRDKRQRSAIEGFAKAHGYTIVAEFYDVVSGADPIAERGQGSRPR
jgi:DNA invertase Pin-like site-specific DNA recombinase